MNRLHVDAGGSLPLGGIVLPCPAGLAGHHTVLVRPEDVQVRTGAAPALPGAAWGQARVLQRTFLGDRVHLRLQVDGQAEAMVSDQPRDCPAAAGDTVHIGIDPARLMAAALKDSA